MHLQPHPQSGRIYRINIDNGNSQAGYDQMLHGQMFHLLDWADRIEQDDDIPRREKEVALLFYAHRCWPDLPVSDPVSPDAIPLQGVVYGTYMSKSDYPGPELDEHRYTAVLQENELIPLD